MSTFLSLKIKIAAVLAVAVVLVGGMYFVQDDVEIVQANPGIDMFMKIGDIKGEADDSGHEDEIDVLSWSWGMSQSGIPKTSRATAGKVHIEELAFTKSIDKATPKLMEALTTGERFPETKFTLRRHGEEEPFEYLVVTMENVMVTSVSIGGSAGEDRLTENITLNFSSIKVAYTEQNEDGSIGEKVEFSYDLEVGTRF